MSIVYVHSAHARRRYTGRRRNVADLARRSETIFFTAAFTLLATCGTIGVFSLASVMGMVHVSL